MDAREIIDAAAAADGVAPVGEAQLRRLDAAVVLDGAGVAVTDAAGGIAELAVHPAHRRRGIGARLLAAVAPAKVWAHGDLPAARALAAAAGLAPTRTLLQMTLADPPADPGPAPAGLRIEDLPAARARLGATAVDAAWLAVNNEAFDWHPEQGGWDAAQLRRARDTDWFDPAGVLFAVAGDGAIVGFHWTKVHPDGVGEVYVIGLADAARGRGAGGWLTRAGLAHLAGRGCRRVILYVEGDNDAAVAVYRRLGFTVSRRDVLYG